MAVEDFDRNIVYLINFWNVKVVRQFTAETINVIELISINPQAFQFYKEQNCYAVPITKQITLFYEFRKNEIILLRFWNNYQNPRGLTLKR